MDGGEREGFRGLGLEGRGEEMGGKEGGRGGAEGGKRGREGKIGFRGLGLVREKREIETVLYIKASDVFL